MASPTRDLQPTPSTEVSGIPEVGATLRGRLPMIAVGAVLGLLVGGLLAFLLPTQYRAAATVKVGAGSVAAGDLSDQNVDAVTQAGIATLRPQIAAIAARLGEADTTVIKRLQVAERPETSLLDFTYTAPSAAKAEAGATVATEVYLAAAQRDAKQRVDNRIAVLTKQFESDEDVDAAAIQQDIRALQLTVADFGEVVQSADGTAKRSVVQPPIYLAVGLLGGLALAALLALLLEAARPKVRRGSRVSGVPLLGRLDDGHDTYDVVDLVLPAALRAGSGGLGVAGVGAVDPEDLTAATTSAPGVRIVDLATTEGLRTAAESSETVLFVRDLTPVSAVRDAVARLSVVGAPLLGMYSVGRVEGARDKKTEPVPDGSA